MKLSFRASFMQKSDVVEPLVSISELLEGFFCVGVAVGTLTCELVSQSQTQSAQRQLMAGFDRQHVFANRFRFLGLIQKTINLSLRESSVNAFRRNCFQFEFHAPSSVRNAVFLVLPSCNFVSFVVIKFFHHKGHEGSRKKPFTRPLSFAPAAAPDHKIHRPPALSAE